MGVLFVTSYGERAGRTAFCAGLARLMSQQGRRPALFKPLRITTDEGVDQSDHDAAFFARLMGGPSPESWPVSISTAEAQQGLKPSTRKRVMSSLEQVTSQADHLIVEGPPAITPGGDALPGTAELAEALNAQVVALLRYAPDLPVEDDVALSKAFGQRLLGVVVNGVTQYRNHTVRSSLVPALEAQGLKVLGIVPEDRRMLGVSVGQLADHLKGKFLLWEEKRDQLVDHLMIGGWILDSGIDYFSRYERKAVIARGDRPDIQMAALGTPTRCLVLTGGHHPIQYVEYEAQEEGVPLLMVESDTVTTAQSLETLFRDVTAHYLDKADCFAELIAKSVDLEALKGVLTSS